MIKLIKVESSFRALGRRLAAAQKRVNADAAAHMRKGDYVSAKSLMEVGASMNDFIERAGAFAEEWKRFSKASRISVSAAAKVKPEGVSSSASERAKKAWETRSQNQKRTPAWKFCTPILRLAIARGGTIDERTIVSEIEAGDVIALTDEDRRVSRAKGEPRWKNAVVRAHQLSQRERWIERSKDSVWKVTAAGRAVCQSEEPPHPS